MSSHARPRVRSAREVPARRLASVGTPGSADPATEPSPPAASAAPTPAAAAPSQSPTAQCWAAHPLVARAGGPPAGLERLFERFPPRVFERGETLIENTRHQTPPQAGSLGYVHEGLVRGAWNGPFIAPENHATTLLAGDGKWIGADVFKYGANLFRYDALTITTASVIPLADFHEHASREAALDALRCVSLDWCTATSVLSLGNDTLERRTMLLLYNLFRLHPRPEIEVRQQDVAEMLGVVRQSLQPILRGLQREGLVSLGYGEIVVGDADALLTALQTTKLPPS